jgi:RNA polymerase subunit RPABC4/transcription elongation factor Spt4
MCAAANEQPHLRLQQLIAQSGTSVLNQPDQCEGWLRQACPQSAWEITLLMAALRQGVAAAMLAPNPVAPTAALRTQLIQRVQANAGLPADAAAWGVDAWAYILNVNLNAAPTQPQPQVRIPAQQQAQINVQPAYAQPQMQAQPLQAQAAAIGAQPYAQPQMVAPAQGFAQPTLNLPDVPGRICPYCGSAAPAQICPTCRRDTTARRRVCSQCGRITPSNELACLACHKHFPNEMAWKVPLIIVLFIVSIIVSAALIASNQ